MLMDSEALQPPPKKLKMASSGDPIDELTTGDLDSPFTELAGLSVSTMHPPLNVLPSLASYTTISVLLKSLSLF